MMELVEYPCSTGSRMTRPPRASTVSLPDYLIGRPVGALDQDVGLDAADDVGRGVVVEDRHGVHAVERGEHFGALLFRVDRALGPFVAADRGVGVEPDDQQIAVRRAAWR